MKSLHDEILSNYKIDISKINNDKIELGWAYVSKNAGRCNAKLLSISIFY